MCSRIYRRTVYDDVEIPDSGLQPLTIQDLLGK